MAGKYEMEIPNKYVPSVALRKYLYGILVAAAAVALLYGVLNAEEVSAWLFLGAAILGLSNGLAYANTPNKNSPVEQGGEG